MTEAEQQQLPEPVDPDVTIATPRFDATEAQVAQPVVPLADVRPRTRTWPLLLLSALLGGAVSLCGLYLYQRPSAHTSTQRPAAQPQPNTSDTAQTAQVATPPPAPRMQASAATSDAEHTAATVSAPAVEELKTAKKEIKGAAEEAQGTGQAARDAGRAARVEHAERVAARHDAARQSGPATDEHTPRAIRPRTVTPTPRPQPRNVDRIRDIFEGTPPPA
jgi:cytoskeletal protein RodZ